LDEEKTKHAQFFSDQTNENWMKKRQNMLSFFQTQQMKIG
jgi:hypothetical protein